MVGAEEGSGAGGDAGLHHREGGQENYEGVEGGKGLKEGGAGGQTVSSSRAFLSSQLQYINQY